MADVLMADVSPTLDSVIRNRGDSASWSKLEDDDNLSRLHSKFWGKKIEVESREWRESNPAVEDDVDNDIGEGCYALDLGIELKSSKLWVRQDYQRIYDYCVKTHAEGPSSAIETARSVVITGQPGVGKSYWVTYAVRRRLGEQNPFLWYRRRRCFLFVDDGVFEKDVQRVDSEQFVPFLWALVDTDESATGVPEPFIDLCTNLYVIFTTSPKKSRWKPMSKTTDCLVIVMNPWYLGEILQAAKIHGFTEEQENRAKDAFKDDGPTARICINSVRSPSLLSHYERHRYNTASNLTADGLRHVVEKGEQLDIDEVSHTLFIIRRRKVEDLDDAYLAPISANVETHLMISINRLQHHERVNLYHNFASAPSTRAVAGLLYESLGHLRLQQGIELNLKRMRKEGKLRTYSHWNTEGVEQTGISVTFPANRVVIYGDMPASIEPDRLYVPKARNQVAFDSFFRLDQTLYIFQLTVADDHDIEEGIKDYLFGLLRMLPSGMNWKIVFITPGGELKVKAKDTPTVNKFLSELELYTADLEFE